MLGPVLLMTVASSAAEPPPGWFDPEREPAAEAAHQEPRRPGDAPVSHGFLLRAGLGMGFVRPSAHDELLAEDGYDLRSRWELTLGAAGVIAKRVALGGYAGVGAGSDAPSSTAPGLVQTVVRAGGEVSLVLQPSRTVMLLVGPEVGVLEGTLSVNGNGQSQTVLEYGGKLGAYFSLGRARPVWYLGTTLAYTFAPSDPPGAVGRDYDYGALHLDLTVVLGG